MSFINKRFVKGKPYYYLEETFTFKGKITKESIYLGSNVPMPVYLFSKFLDLEKACKKKGHLILVPPLTEFLANKTALNLKKAKQNKKAYFASLSKKQREEFIKRERITFITESNAIEGSTLNYSETAHILGEEKRINAAEMKGYAITNIDREEQEALNLNACLNLYDKLLKKKAQLSEEIILHLHYILLKKIPGYEKYQGIYRPVEIYIRGSNHVFPLPQEVSGLMKKLLNWYLENENLIHPVELAAKFHTKFTTIHPFADGNGRMARLLMNYILQSKEFPFTNIPLKKRNEYMKTQAAGNENNHKPFTKFLTEEIIKQHLKKHAKRLKS